MVTSMAISRLPGGTALSGFRLEKLNAALGAASPGLRFRLRAPNGSNLFNDLAADSGLVPLPSSGTYVLTAYAAPGEAALSS